MITILLKLNNRGYTTIPSIVDYKPDIMANTSILFPPSDYPPTSPYYNLTKNFKRLLKRRIINGEILKYLLYKEYVILNEGRVNDIQKRTHRNTADFYFSEGDSINENHPRSGLRRQNAIEYRSDLTDNPIKLRNVQLHIFNGDESANSSFEYTQSPKQYKAWENLANMGISSDTENSTEFVPKSSQSLPTTLKVSKNKPDMYLSCLNIRPSMTSNLSTNLRQFAKRDFLPNHCRCCSHFCNSPRSSDSGVAESCTIRSPNFSIPSTSTDKYININLCRPY